MAGSRSPLLAFGLALALGGLSYLAVHLVAHWELAQAGRIAPPADLLELLAEVAAAYGWSLSAWLALAGASGVGVWRFATRQRLALERERRQAAELAEAEARQRALYQAVACGVLVLDHSEVITHANAEAEALLGLSFDEMRGRRHAELWSVTREDGSPLPDEQRPLYRALRQGRSVRDQVLRLATPDGEQRWVLVNVEPLRDARGRVRQAVVSFLDITRRLRLERELEQRALYDALTGLPNRALLMDRLGQAVLACQREGRPAALLVLDLDDFNEFNATFGYAAGDALLREVGRRLRGALRALDSVARLGGNEFAILLPGVDALGAQVAAARMAAALDAPLALEGVELHARASLGIALCPEHGQDAETLLRRATAAVALARRNGSGYATWVPELEREVATRLTLVEGLRHGIERGELLLHFQPVLALRGRRVLAAEALVRWQHPALGLVLPDQFIPLAEQTGLVRALTRWVLEAALRQATEWRARGLDLAVAVNLSARDLLDPRLPEKVMGALARQGVPPDRLIVELTESALMADPAQAAGSLARLREQGVQVAVDDFGTGYSSLAYLKRLPVDELKIDRAFVREVAVDPDSYAIVRATVELGHALGLRVVAEGVEDRASLELLAALGCDQAQGYYLSRPLPPAELEAWLGQRNGSAGQ